MDWSLFYDRNLRLLVSMVVYLAVGCLYYTLNEVKYCESDSALESPDYDEESCVEPWSVVDALYFSMVTMSTVGFGDLSPSKPESKVFTCIFIFVGISVVFSQMSEVLAGVVDTAENFTFAVLHKLIPWTPVPQVVDIDGDGKPDFEMPAGPLAYWIKHLAFPVVVVILLQFMSAAVFCAVQEELSYWDAFYHCFVTATTVGYGDISLTTPGSRMCAFFHIALSVSWLAAVLTEISMRKKLRVCELREVQLLARRMDVEWMQSLDRTGDGVDKADYIVGMLIQLGGVEFCGRPLTWADVKPFATQFEAADADGSGVLTKEDLASLANKHTESMGTERAQLIRQLSMSLDFSLDKPERKSRYSPTRDRRLSLWSVGTDGLATPSSPRLSTALSEFALPEATIKKPETASTESEVQDVKCEVRSAGWLDTD